jgi:hypothetical protein
MKRCPVFARSSAIIVVLIFALLVIPVSLSRPVQGDEEWRTFQGAWFAIKFPPGFMVRPSLPSNSAVNGFDSVFFTAPDGSVEFYVFSPQWTGFPTDIEIDPMIEVLVSFDVTQRAGKSIRRITIAARDGSYQKSIEDIQDSVTKTRRVFGITYVNTAAYNYYKETYLIFKASLCLFAD